MGYRFVGLRIEHLGGEGGVLADDTPLANRDWSAQAKPGTVAEDRQMTR